MRPTRATLSGLVRGGGPIAVFFLAMAVQPFTDVILPKLAPPEVVGWYGAARNIMGLLLVPAAILGTASFPELSRLSSSVPDLRYALRAILRLLLGLGPDGRWHVPVRGCCSEPHLRARPFRSSRFGAPDLRHCIADIHD